MNHFNWRVKPCRTFHEAEDGSLAFIIGKTMARMSSKNFAKYAHTCPVPSYQRFQYVWWMYNELASWHCILQGLPWQLMLALPGFHLFQSSHTCWLLGNKNLCHGSKLRWKSTKDTERFHCRQSGHRAWEGSPYTYAFIIDCVPSLMLPEFLPYKWVFGWKTHYGAQTFWGYTWCPWQ